MWETILHLCCLSELVLYICYIHSVDWGREGVSIGSFCTFFECFAELFVFILCEEYFMLHALQAKEPCNAFFFTKNVISLIFLILSTVHLP